MREEIEKFLRENNLNNEIIENEDNLTVGGSLYLRGTGITDARKERKKVKELFLGYCKERNYIYFDNILWGNVQSIHKIEGITVYKTPLGYCVVQKEYCAHGDSLREAIEDLAFKKLENKDISEIILAIKKKGKVTKVQYRAITGACRKGTNNFCRQHNIEEDEISLEDLRKILKNDYGAERFWELIDNT